MNNVPMFTIKICGVTSIEDARIVADSKADAIGVNFYSKSKRFVSADRAREICDVVSGSLLRVGVFVNESAEAILRIVDRTGIDAVQLHGDEPASILSELESVPTLKAFRCKNADLSPVAKFLKAAYDPEELHRRTVLIDAFHSGEYGGTGKTVDPRLLAKHAPELGNANWVLAGGLTPDNVTEAIRLTGARAVDTASGVELEPGKKDAAKVRQFAEQAKLAFRETFD